MPRKDGQIISSAIMKCSIILWCVVLCVHSSCLSAHLDGGECEQIQEAGQALADNVREFDELLQDLIMRCFEESQLIINSSLSFMTKNAAGIAPSASKKLTPMESDGQIQQIMVLMSKQLDASFDSGYNQYFTLLKRAGYLVVGDSIVVDALVKYQKSGRKRRSVHNIDDKIKTLRYDMNTSLSGVEKNLHGVAKQLFIMLTTSLKELSDDQEYRKNLDNKRLSMVTYLLGALHTVIESHIERFFLILKSGAQQIEIIDSHVADVKSDPTKLTNAIKPAKVLVDESIQHLQKRVGVTEMKRQLKLKLVWMQETFKALKSKV